MGCFKLVLAKLKRDVQKKMGNLSAVKVNDEKFERLSEKSSDKSCKDFEIPTWLEEASNPRVAMDFTDGVGRIVHDPEEVRAIAESERYHVSRNSRYMQCNDNEKFEILTSGEHIKQRYYHGNLTRAAAGKLVVKNGKDGAFLVRESHNRPGWLVITYFWCGKAHHQYIRPVILPDSDKKTGIYLATCDAETVFYDVHSLLEFYRLNKGPLYTRLSESIKNQSQPNRTPPRERKTILAGVDFKPWFMKPQSTLSQAEDQAQSQAQASTSTADPSQPQTPQSSQNLQSFSLNVPPTDTVSTSPENNRSTDEAQTQTAPTQTQGDKPSPEI